MNTNASHNPLSHDPPSNGLDSTIKRDGSENVNANTFLNGQHYPEQLFQLMKQTSVSFEYGRAWAFRKDFLTKYHSIMDCFLSGYEELFLTSIMMGKFTSIFEGIISEKLKETVR